MGLLRGMARTAVVAGTATAVSNRVSRRQARRWDAEDQANQAPVQTVEASGPSQIEQLQELGRLKESGVLTQEEFEVQKAKVLNS